VLNLVVEGAVTAILHKDVVVVLAVALDRLNTNEVRVRRKLTKHLQLGFH